MSIPYYVIAGSVAPGNRLKGFYQEGGLSPAHLLDHPTPLRYAGFDVSTGDYARLVGDHWQVRNGDRKVIQLYQDGDLLFRMRADEDFLGWGGQNLSMRGWLNPVAVVESHVSFVSLYAALVPHFLRPPDQIRFTLRFENGLIDGARLALTRYYTNGIRRVHAPTLYPIHDPNASAVVESHAALLLARPDRVAYQVLTRFYELFDAGPDLIPFVVEGVTEGTMDIAAIAELR